MSRFRFCIAVVICSLSAAFTTEFIDDVGIPRYNLDLTYVYNNFWEKMIDFPSVSTTAYNEIVSQ